MATSPSYYGNYGDSELPTLNTVADYIAEAHTLLQDKVPDYRYDEQSLLTAFNITLLHARRLRADLFVYNLAVMGQVQSFKVVDDTKVVMEAQFRPYILHGLCGHALERDQEDVQDLRSATFMNIFYIGLVGRGMPGVAGGSAPGGRQGQ